MSESIPYYSAEALDRLLSFPALVKVLKKGFQADYTVPHRMHVDYRMPTSESTNTLLLMPALSHTDSGGVKMVTVNPDNSQKGLPGIQGVYYLFDAATGVPRALIDAKALTNWRTAATSALAAGFLAPSKASRLLMIGTGALASYLMDAHAAIRPIDEVLIWGRSPEKAAELAEKKRPHFHKVTPVTHLASAVKDADIISAATFSTQPLINGEWLRPGQHIDLVGSYRPDMREADDTVIRRSDLFVDSMLTAPKESGDLALPLAQKVISMDDIQGDLFQLCRSEIKGRQSEEAITLFKSVGHALEDLVTAEYIIQNS